MHDVAIDQRRLTKKQVSGPLFSLQNLSQCFANIEGFWAGGQLLNFSIVWGERYAPSFLLSFRRLEHIKRATELVGMGLTLPFSSKSVAKVVQTVSEDRALGYSKKIFWAGVSCVNELTEATLFFSQNRLAFEGLKLGRDFLHFVYYGTSLLLEGPALLASYEHGWGRLGQQEILIKAMQAIVSVMISLLALSTMQGLICGGYLADLFINLNLLWAALKIVSSLSAGARS